MSVHDLGYRRYAGPRRTGSQLWRVIARRGLHSSVRSGWVIVALVLVLIVLVFGVVGVYVTLKIGSEFSRVTGVSINFFLFNVGKADRYLGEALALIIGSSVLTDDFRTGAFAFYFSRPVTRAAYLLGKLVPVALVVAVAAMATTTLMSLEVLAIRGDASGLILLGRALGHGLCATIALCAPAALISALVRRRIWGMAIYFALFAGTAAIAETLARLGARWAVHVGLGNNIDIVGQALYGRPLDGSPLVALAILFVLSAASLLVAYRRLRQVDILE